MIDLNAADLDVVALLELGDDCGRRISLADGVFSR